jgi:hypothetical protein
MTTFTHSFSGSKTNRNETQKDNLIKPSPPEIQRWEKGERNRKEKEEDRATFYVSIIK